MYYIINYITSSGSIDATYDVIVAKEANITQDNLLITMNNEIKANNGKLLGLTNYTVESTNEIGKQFITNSA